MFRRISLDLNKLTCNALANMHCALSIESANCRELAYRTHANPFRDLPSDILMVDLLLRVSTQRLAPVDGRLTQNATDLFALQGHLVLLTRYSKLTFLRSRLPDL